MRSFKVKNMLVFAVVLFSQISTFANTTDYGDDHSKLIVKQVDDATFLVRVINLEDQLTTITLKDEDGQELFTKKVTADVAYASKLNLSYLPSGKYLLSVNRANKSFSQPIFIKGATVALGELKEIVRPRIELSEEAFAISQKDINVNSVKITNDYNEVIYFKNFNNNTTEKLQFNVADLPNGTYIIGVETVDDIYFERLVIK